MVPGAAFLGSVAPMVSRPLEDGAFGFEDQGEDFAGAHEVGELAEEGALFVNSVEAASFFFGETHGFDGDNLEARFVNARKEFRLADRDLRRRV